jgi:SIR2-like protein
VTRVLLLGAGFTRNWGGRLASDFVGTLCRRVVDRPHLNEMLRLSGNFEQVFGSRVIVARREPDNAQAIEDVRRLSQAIRETFRDMNAGLVNRQFGFSDDGRCSIRRFLSRFDAIFTLNQDLLLELHYDGALLENHTRWNACAFPGVPYTHDWLNPRMKVDRLDLVLRAAASAAAPDPRVQPVYKLHGSVNWRSADNSDLLVIGTGKEEAIAGIPLLRQYGEIFRECLFRGGTEIMVIGYGFADPHINEALLEAARRHSLKMFLVNPAGTNAFEAHHRSAATGRSELLEIPLVGLCQRGLSEVFADFDNPAMQDIEEFLRK